MSIHHVAAVLYKMPDLQARGAAFALMAIADSADRVSGWSWHITVGAIAAASRMTERGARKCLRELEAGGYIRTEVSSGRTPRYRLLFDEHGTRKPEAELYTPARRSGVPKATPAPRSGGAALRSGGAEPRAGVPNNPNKESVSLPSSIQKSDQKIAARKTKKIPAAKSAPDIEAERRRQLAELQRRAVS